MVWRKQNGPELRPSSPWSWLVIQFGGYESRPDQPNASGVSIGQVWSVPIAAAPGHPRLVDHEYLVAAGRFARAYPGSSNTNEAEEKLQRFAPGARPGGRARIAIRITPARVQVTPSGRKGRG